MASNLDGGLLTLRLAHRDNLPKHAYSSHGENQRSDRAQLLAYAEAMGIEPEQVVNKLQGDPQWSYGSARSSKERDAAIFYAVTGALVPRATTRKRVKASLPPLERISKARRARTRAENELRAAVSAARESHTLQEIATVLGVSRQRVSQIVAASKS